MGGWSIPQAMFCYTAARHVFGLRRMNEVLTSDSTYRQFAAEKIR
jgi:hypothetical protein